MTHYGTITEIGQNLSHICTVGGIKYAYETSRYPNFSLGDNVFFRRDNENSNLQVSYATDLEASVMRDNVIQEILRRIAKLEARLTSGNKFAKEEERDYSQPTSENT